MIRLDFEDLRFRWRSLSARSKLGVILIAAANLFLGMLLLIPFWEADFSTKAILSAGLFIIGEVLFYSGLFLLGKELAARYKQFLNPKHWFGKKGKEDEGSGN